MSCLLSVLKLLTLLFLRISKRIKWRHSLILSYPRIILLISLRISRHRRPILLSCSKTCLKLPTHIAWLLSSHHHMSSVSLLLITHLIYWDKTYMLILDQLLTYKHWVGNKFSFLCLCRLLDGCYLIARRKRVV